MTSKSLAVGAVLLAVLAASGCQRSVNREPAAPAKAVHDLSFRDLSRSLLTEDSVGDGFEKSTGGPDLQVIGPGCLSTFDAISRTSFPRREHQAYINAEDDRPPWVFQAAATYYEKSEAAAAVEAMRAKIATCTKVVDRDKGSVLRLKISHDDTRHTAGVDAELNVTATGTVSLAEDSVPFSVRFEAVQVANNVLLIGFYSYEENAGTQEIEALARIAVRRITAVAAGDTPPDDRLDLRPLQGGSLGA